MQSASDENIIEEVGEGPIFADQNSINATNSEIKTSKQVYCDMLKLAVPFAASLFVSIAGDALVIKILAELSPSEFAASGLIMSSQSLLMSPLFSFISIVSTYAGDAKGDSDKTNVGRIFRQGLFLAVILSIPAIIIASCMEYILVGFNESKQHAKIAGDFFYARILGIPSTLALAVNQLIAIGISDPYIPALSTFSSTIVSTILGYGLVLGKFGTEPLGVKGWAYALNIAMTFDLIASTLYYRLSQKFKPFQFFARDYRSFIPSLDLIKKGIPLALQSWVDIAALSVPLLFVGWRGENSLIAQQTVMLYYSIFSTSIAAISQVIIGRIAEAQKRNFVNEIKHYARSAFVLSFGIAVAGLILFYSAPKSLSSLLINVNDPKYNEAVSLATSLFIIHGVGLVLDALRTVATGLLRAVKITGFPLISSLVTAAVAISLGYALGIKNDMGANGIYISRDIALTISAIMLCTKWLKMINALTPSSANNELDRPFFRSKTFLIPHQTTTVSIFSPLLTPHNEPERYGQFDSIQFSVEESHVIH